MLWYSLILIFACQGNPGAMSWSPTDRQADCDKGHWGYTEPLLDFMSKSDCNTAGHRFITQQPHVYVTWHCVIDPNKTAAAEEAKPWWRFW